MNKINSILTLAFLCFNINLSLSQKTQLTTKWQSEKYDNIEDLSNMDFLYDSEDGLLFLITNDNENLYIHLRTIDEIPEKKLIEFGFSIELKVKGNKDKRVVEYPLPQRERMQPVILLQNNSVERRQDFNLIKEQIIMQIYQMRLTGFKENENLIVKASENVFNIIGSMKINKNGQLQYLVTIPLKALGVSLTDEISMNINLQSGMETVQNQGSTSSADEVGQDGGIRGQGGQQGIGGQGGSQFPQQVKMNGDEDSGERQQHMEERTEMSKAIIVRLKKMVLAKKP